MTSVNLIELTVPCDYFDFVRVPVASVLACIFPLFNLASSKPVVHLHFALDASVLMNVLRDFSPPEEFIETFYDTADFNLAEANFWLKKVGETYSLKRFVHSVVENFALEYVEQSFSSLEDALESLRPVFPTLKIVDFKILASFPVIRYKKDLNERTILKIDITKFADDDYYAIGTVETTDRSKDFVSGLGFSWINQIQLPVQSTIVEYIYLYNPSLYSRLSKKHIVIDNFVSQAGINHFESFDKSLDDLPPPTEEESKRIEELFALLKMTSLEQKEQEELAKSVRVPLLQHLEEYYEFKKKLERRA